MTDEEEFPVDEQAILAGLQSWPRFQAMTAAEQAFELRMWVANTRLGLRNEKYPPPGWENYDHKPIGLDEDYKPFPLD